MRVSVAGKATGLLIALVLGATSPGAGQDHPHRHHRGQPLAGDTVRGKVLGTPVLRDGARPGHRGRRAVIRGRAMRCRPACGGMMHGGMMHGGMMHGAMPGPALLLLHRESLALTPEQVQRLEVLAATQRRAVEQLMPEAMRAMADLMAAVSGEIDIDAARAAHDRLARVHSEMMVAGLQAMKDARQTLTPGQLTRWDAMIAQMGGMMRMMGPMGPMMGPMMMGGERGESMR